ncbi:hypothetical protein ACGFI4_29280 [Micromonospora carbonacea]|uniref:hypothetical protein n=1 Tax=Micromonospora carbonacea TaxID=47853 RepID=UPI0037106723
MTITIPLKHPNPIPSAPPRAAGDQLPAGPSTPDPTPGPTPPARRSLGSRWRQALHRMRRSVLAIADDCPPILLYTAHRN